MRPIIALLLLAAACRCTSAQSGEPQDELRRRIEELSRELLRLRGELVRARIEILDLKLREARKNPDEERRLLVRDGLDSGFPEVQQHAFKELVGLPLERRRTAVPEVLERWRKADERFRVLAISFLSIADHPEAEEVLMGAARDPSPDVRKAVASVLNVTANEKAFAVVVEMLKDPEKDVRASAVDALGLSRRDEAIPPLLEFLRAERDPTLQEKAADALGKIGKVAAVPALLDLLTSDQPGIRWSCINSLGVIGDPQAIERLRPFLDPNQPPHIREIAILSLGKLKDEASLPSFEKMVSQEAEPRLRQAAAEAIGRLGFAAALNDTLLPAYEKEREESVRKAVWKSILRLSEKDLDRLDSLTSWAVDRKYKGEIEEVARIVYAWKGTDDAARIVAVVEKIAGFTYGEKSWLQALEHYKMLVQYAPQRWEGYRRMATCYSELGDLESALTTLGSAAEKTKEDRPVWWSFKEDTLAVLLRLDDPSRIVEESYDLLRVNPGPEPLRVSLRSAYDSAAGRIIDSLRSGDESARRAAVARAHRLGKRILLPLAAALEAAPAPGLIEAGNAIAGTHLDPSASDAARAKETADAWRMWHEKNP